MDYIRGWAWQTVLLQQRLHYKRHHQQQQQQQSIVQTEDIDDDETTKQPQRQPPLPPPPNVVLLLEHEPVYTLGRGATVDHVTGLFRSLPPIKAAAACPDDSTTTTTTTDRYDSFRRRLDRQYRGADAARLTAPPSTDNWFARRDDDDNGTSHQNLNDNIDNTEEVRRLFSEATVAQELLVRHIQTQQHELAQASIPPVVVPPSPSILSYSKNEGYGVPIYRVERGGEVTFHGPGQLIVYPIWDLTSDPAIFQSDLHWYLRCLEQAVIDAVTELLLQQQQKSQTDKEQRQQHEDMERFVESSSPPSLPQVHRDENHTGVWINQRDKIAAVGVASSRWITSHGIALNVTTDLSFFDPEVIVPCGIPSSLVLSDDTDDDNNRNSRGVTSLEKLGVEASVPEVAAILLKHMARIFNVDFVTGDPIQ